LSTPYNPWPVDSNASYSDSIGWYPSGVVTDIRNFRSANGLAMPCDVAVPQQMKMLTCPGAPVYQSHNVTMRIGATTFQVGRANVTVARTWPVNRAAFLSTEMNQYVAAEGGGNSYLIANRNSIGAWEEFGLEHIVANVYALVVSNGKYVAAVGGGNGDVVADRTQVGPWEQFEMIEQGGDQVVFRTYGGQYLRVVPSQGGLIDARGQAPGPWEMFVRVPR